MMRGTKNDTISRIICTLLCLWHNMGYVESHLNIESTKRALRTLSLKNTASKLSGSLLFLNFSKSCYWRPRQRIKSFLFLFSTHTFTRQ